MVFAKNSKSAANLSEQIRNRRFKKTYLAVVHGILKNNSGELRNYLLKDTKTNTVKVVDSKTPGSKEAILKYKVLEFKNNLRLLEIELETGRPHQIRVQLANIASPLYGDSKYGNGVVSKEGIALWSYKIEFTHPGSKELVEFKSNIPKYYPWNQFKIPQNQ